MEELSAVCRHIRKEILKTSFESQAGHIPSAFSIIEILYVLYKDILNDNDIFVLSKGHGCLALYGIFAEFGIITREELLSFAQYDSLLGGHPHRNKLKEIYASTGSLGHGLPICAGAALAIKLDHRNDKVYCLVGDGECNEGTIWETAMLADRMQLNNLVCIVDNNKSQTRSMPSTNIGAKFRSFGWDVTEVTDGHSHSALRDALSLSGKKPLCIVCNTVKGRGVSAMEEDMFAWHHGPPNAEQLKKFCEELSA